MRKVKKFSILALGLIPLLLVVTLLPAGAETALREKGDERSQELVVCETDASGIIQEIRVFDTLGIADSGQGSVDVKEEYLFAGDDPAKIVGVTSSAKPEIDGDYMVWKGVNTDTNSNIIADIQFSKAMVDEAKTRIPLKVTYQYFFDGKLVEGPEAIVGKTGHFRLEATFVNTSGEMTPIPYKDPTTGETLFQRTDVYLPLVIQPYDWKFDNQHFFNLKTDPMAVIIPKPDVTQPGWTIPLFPPATEPKQSIWVEADVKDFRMPALALVIAFKFPTTNQANALETLGPGLEDLYGGIITLDEGLNKAVAGLGSAATPDTLIYGIGQIYDGLLKLSSNTEGLGKAKAGLDSQLIPGVNQLYGGINQMYGGSGLLIDSMGAAKAGVAELSAGIDQIMLGISTGSMSDPGLKEGLQQMVAGLNTQLIPGLQMMRAGIGPESDPDTLLGQVSALIANFTVDNSGAFPPGPPPLGLTLRGFIENPAKFGGGLAGSSYPFLDGQLDGMAAELDDGKDGIELMYTMLGDGTDPDTVIGGLFYMSAVLNSMVNGIGTAADPGTLLNGLAQVKMGLGILDAGFGSAGNPNSLIGGMTQINYGLASASGGTSQISGGLTELSGGLGSAIAGIGSAGTPDTLLYGANLIEGGLNDLQGGLTQATDEGTQLMITGLDGSLKTINLTNSELKALQVRAAEFDAFLGKPVDGESMMRFIYQTPAVYSYKDGGSTSHWVAIILSILIILILLALGLFVFRKLA